VKHPEVTMSTLQHVADFDFAAESAAPETEAAVPRWLRRIAGKRARRRAAPVPVYRITRVAADRWVVERPGASMEHAFANLEEAVTFIRHECLYAPATVELRVDDLYVVAQLDPNKPGSLFGESVS
jgi:hypothetical protein